MQLCGALPAGRCGHQRVVIPFAQEKVKTVENLEKPAESAAVEKLLAIAAESANLDPAEVLDYLHDPDWENQGGRDWELYIPRGMRRIWDSLSDESRLCGLILALSRIHDGAMLERD